MKTILIIAAALVVGFALGRVEERAVIMRAVVNDPDFSTVCGPAYRIYTGKDGWALSCWDTSKFFLAPKPDNQQWERIK